jgi:hypothetical protein
MLRNRDDIERFLETRVRAFTAVDDATFLVTLAPEQPAAVLRVQPPVMLVQVDIGAAIFEDLAHECAFYRKLLELNSADLLHAAYGLNGNRAQLSAALELDHLDENELEATLSDVTLALANHVPVLRQMVTAKA